MAATIKLYKAKDKIYETFRSKLNKVAVVNINPSLPDSIDIQTQGAAGYAELKNLTFEATGFKTTNTVSTQVPLLFGVAPNKTANTLVYLGENTAGTVYTILAKRPTGHVQVSYDSNIHARYLELIVKGDGE